jgi:hypothetical protein
MDYVIFGKTQVMGREFFNIAAGRKYAGAE